MPGVPSGRGCEACRKQKKKCDQARPSCSRCSRIGIACIGSGQRRYKFVEEPVASKTNSLVPASHRAPCLKVNSITWVPSNGMTMVTGAFCSALSVTDVRYDLSVYGQFFKDIPRRLGENAALDASAGALTAAFNSIYSGNRSVEAIEKYVHALGTLRASLSDPVEVKSPNTLCAIYLMIVCQGWIGQHDDCTGHGEAVAYLLSIMASQGYQAQFGQEFESELILTLCVPVIFESIGNPKIKLHPWLWKLTEAHDKTVTLEGMRLGNLAKLPGFIKYPELHLLEIETLHQTIQNDLPQTRLIISKLSEQGMVTMHARYQALHGILLGSSIILSTIMYYFGNGDINTVADTEALIDELIAIAEDGLQYRPLGSSSVPLILTVGWVASREVSRRAKIEGLIAEYQKDFAISRWMEVAGWFEQELNGRCGEMLSTTKEAMQVQSPKNGVRECCVM
ncbi:hypothetical protein BGZ60DRAFT_418471 [Tricladium varicosporioides]|nr:hypothetical protein BGZ60DRAFT_418471 [Hymenoscyphus varicosporioides]